jgi:outer membrane lipoprotein-sorting protein
MPKKIRALALALCFALTVVFSLSLTASAAEFSADIKYEGKGTDQAVPGKFYIKGKLLRQDVTIAQRGKMIMVVNLKTRETMAIIPQAKMYTQGVAPIPTGDRKHFMWESAEKSLPKGTKKVGTEVVSGYKCDVYAYTDPKENAQRKLWVATKLNFPIQIQTKGPEGDFKMILSNIKQGGVSDALFKPPAGYRKMQMPAGGQMPGQR